jgi:ubiquinone/menaquinone biosynthesis C-methylase UbiE
VDDGVMGAVGGGFAADGVAENYQRWLVPPVFEPWSQVLVEQAGIVPGQVVLDVACGTGVVARAAAAVVGPSGLVIAADLNAPMLTCAATQRASEGAAPIRYIDTPAEVLPSDDESFDVVLCQQGLQFFGDQRGTAVAEWLRVLRFGGIAAASVWATGHKIEPFDTYSEVALEAGIEPPFPGAFDVGAFAMPPETVAGLFEAAGFSLVELTTVELEVRWAAVTDAVAGIYGSVFGSLLAGLDDDRREAVHASLARRFAAPTADGSVSRRTVAAVVTAAR